MGLADLAAALQFHSRAEVSAGLVTDRCGNVSPLPNRSNIPKSPVTAPANNQPRVVSGHIRSARMHQPEGRYGDGDEQKVASARRTEQPTTALTQLRLLTRQ
jgi:hypothetical protein